MNIMASTNEEAKIHRGGMGVGTEARDIPSLTAISLRNGRFCGHGRDRRDGGLSPRMMDPGLENDGSCVIMVTAVCPRFCNPRESDGDPTGS